jgi:hypothetical protein
VLHRRRYWMHSSRRTTICTVADLRSSKFALLYNPF